MTGEAAPRSDKPSVIASPSTSLRAGAAKRSPRSRRLPWPFGPRNDKVGAPRDDNIFLWNGDGMAEFSVVTGAFSYTGRYIAQRLLALGQSVKTIPRHPPPWSGGGIEVAPLNFANHNGFVEALRGATTLYNTYWVRFPRGRVTFEQAVANTERLIDAAVAAGGRRIVHISGTNAEATSSLPYFKGKG